MPNVNGKPMVNRKTDAHAVLQLVPLLLAGVLLFTPVLQAQNLLKPGQGLVGAPKPIEPKPDADKNRPPPKAPEAEQMPQVDVEGQRDPMSEADKRLEAQKKRLPGLGTDKARTKGAAERALDYYNNLEKDPNKLNPETQEFLDRVVNTPDDNHRNDYVTLPRRDGADYEDPIAAQQQAAKKK